MRHEREKMPNLGTKYVCFSCQTKFYDLGRDTAVCPKCSADQKDSDSSPAPATRTRRAAIQHFDDEKEKKPAPTDDAEEVEVAADGAAKSDKSDDADAEDDA